MNTPIEISNLSEYFDCIKQITAPNKSYLYRGQENADWKIQSSGYRRITHEESDDEFGTKIELFVSYLIQIIDEVRLNYPSTYLEMSPLECMAHLQHHKVATGLIDFTFNPLVALWFACTEHNGNDGKIFVLENDSDKIEEITTKEKLNQDLDTFFRNPQTQWYLWTPSLDSNVVDTQRLTRQQSVFLFGRYEITADMNMQEIVISHQHKELIRGDLEKMAISEITLFPDLLGFFERNTHAHPYDLPTITTSEGGNL